MRFDVQDELSFGVEMKEGFVVDCSTDVEEIDRCPSGQRAPSGLDPFGGKMEIVDHHTNFGR